MLLTQLLKVNGLVLMKKAKTDSFQCSSCAQSETLKTVTTGIHKHHWIVLGNRRCSTPAKFMSCFCTKFHVSDPSRLSVSPSYPKIKRIFFAPSPDLCYTLHKNINSQEVLCFQKPYFRMWPQDTAINCAIAASIPQVHTSTALLVCWRYKALMSSGRCRPGSDVSDKRGSAYLT